VELVGPVHKEPRKIQCRSSPRETEAGVPDGITMFDAGITKCASRYLHYMAVVYSPCHDIDEI
jgi:hypothetical protein